MYEAKLGAMKESNGNVTYFVHVLDSTKKRDRFDLGVQVYSGTGLRSAIIVCQELQVEFGHYKRIDTGFISEKFGVDKAEVDKAWEDVFLVHYEFEKLGE